MMRERERERESYENIDHREREKRFCERNNETTGR
jgi:hypothetical protein